jgi:hypothetical protein
MYYTKFAALAGLLLASTSTAYAATDTASAGGSASITLFRPLTITTVRKNIGFGTIVEPSTGTSTVSLNASDTPTRTVTGSDGVALGSSSYQTASFTVNGEGGQAATLTIPTTVTLNNGANTLTLNTNNNAGVTSSGNITLSGALGAAGTKNVFIGGSIDVAAGAATGTYATTADFTITTTYN